MRIVLLSTFKREYLKVDFVAPVGITKNSSYWLEERF